MSTLARAELDAVIEEATVDAYGEDEERTGLFTRLLPSPVPEGAQWIEAYRHWAGRSRTSLTSRRTGSCERAERD